MKKKLAAAVSVLGIYAPIASAGTNQLKPGDTAALIAFGISFTALAYAGNKWRSWYVGFQVGGASGSEFLSALKWSAIGVVIVVASFGVAWLLN